ncbi:MAG: TIGR02206 family membrane protein [Bacteroidetes bacterium MED-G21]|nr:MAG: TIGR02206 family membrane protein [Bacteroidetes bacterium MED-G21]
MDHVVIAPFGAEWFFWNILTLFFILLLVLIPRNKSDKFKSNCTTFFALLMAFEYVFIQSYFVYKGIWTPQDSLPFHLCRLMLFNTIILLFTRNQIAFELLLFIGMVGGFHSLMTPELTHGSDLVLLIDYFLVHGGLVAAPLYCIFVLGMRPRKMAWLKSFFYLQFFVAVVAIIDYLLGANYMYLAVKPVVNNPFLIGNWPYYIIGLELATLLHAFLVYIPFYLKKSFSPS